MDVLTRAAHPGALHRFGSHAHRIAFIGDDTVLGLGIGSAESALPGQVADLVTPLTDRGLDADLFTGPEWTARAVAELGDGMRLDRYDAVVLGFAPASWLLPSRSRRRIRESLEVVLGATNPDAAVVVLGTGSPAHERRAARTREVVAAWCTDPERGSRDVVLIEEPVTEDEDADVLALAAIVARRLVDGLSDESAGRRRRNSADEERARQRAVDASGVLDIEPDDAMRALLDRARTAFGTPSAELTVIDGDRLRKAAIAGSEPGGLPRDQAFCDLTIRHSDGFVVGDTRDDARFDGFPGARGEHPVRFYAGFPIESVDGYRIGAICVYDFSPRDASGFDLAVLRDIALTAQGLIQRHALAGQAA